MQQLDADSILERDLFDFELQPLTFSDVEHSLDSAQQMEGTRVDEQSEVMESDPSVKKSKY